MKLNKYLLGLAVVAMGGLTACNTDVEGEFYPYSTDYAQFDAASHSVSLSNTEDHVTIPINLTRANTSGALTVNFTAAASHEGIFSNDANGTVTFAPGQGTATFNVTAQNLEKEVAYQYALSLAGDPVGVLTMVQNGDTIDYEPGQLLKTVIKVQREGDWTSWTAWNSEGTADYLYTGSFFDPGWDEDLPFYYRQSITNPTQYKFRIDHWGYDVTMNLDYDESTGRVSLPPTFTGYTHSSYGDVYICDIANYNIMNGDEAGADDYGTFDKESGIIAVPVIYYVDAGYFGYNMEYIYIDGYVRTDYSMELTYEGYLTDKDGNVYAQGNLTLSDDIEKAIAIVAPKDADPEAVADGIAAGDYEGVEVESGQIRVPIGEDLTGELQLIVAIIEDGEVKNVESVYFEYYGGAANPWKSLGIGYYVDDFIVPFYGYDPYTVEVEILESNETPGLYRIKNAYADVAAAFGETGGEKDIFIHAENPNGVYFTTQPTGIDFGKGEFSIISEGGNYIEYYIGKGYSEEQVIGGLPELFGSLSDGIITLPILPITDEQDNPVYNEDGTPAVYQGYLLRGTSAYYSCTNGAFKIVLPSAAASVKAKAKKQSMSVSKTLLKINKTMMKSAPSKQMRPGSSKKTIRKHLIVFKR